MNTINILLTSVGRRSYLVEYFRKCKDIGKVHAANSVDTYTLKLADMSVLTPNIHDDIYIDFLIDYCKTYNINAIVSCFDVDLPVLSRNKKIFKENSIDVIVSDFEIIDICNDKYKSYLHLKKNNFKTPDTYINISDALLAIKTQNIQFPVILKPRWGMGSIGIFEADNVDELNIFYNKIVNIIEKTYLKYEARQNLSECVLIQEKIIGEEYGLDVINDLNGNYCNTIVKQKMQMRAGETDQAQVFIKSELQVLGKNISESLKHIANLDLDCILTKDNTPVVIEMNPRFGGQYPFSHLAGVDLPQQIINWLLNKSTSSDLLQPKVNIIACKEIVPTIFHLEE